jgi:hypothetical protein
MTNSGEQILPSPDNLVNTSHSASADKILIDEVNLAVRVFS